MKKIISLFTTLCIVFTMLGIFTVFAEEDTQTDGISLKAGDYVQMGTYNGEPILWRCVAFEKIKGYESDGTPVTDSTDTVSEYKNGYLPLMLSDKIICCKAFDACTNLNSEAGSNSETGSHSRRKRPTTTASNYWADSNIRSWLNSEESAGNVVWLCGNPPHPDDRNNVLYGGYENEAGFLTNFSESERSIIKAVSQKSIVAGSDKDLDYITGEALHKYKYGLPEFVQNYDEAYSEQVKDKMFMLDVKQADTVYRNNETLGEDYLLAYPTEQAVENAHSNGINKIETDAKWEYYLRTPYCTDPDRADTEVRKVFTANGGYVGASSVAFGSTGVRPAFFLDLPNTFFSSGGGTEESPYIAAPLSENKLTKISTLEELEAFRDDVNNGNTYEGKIVKLTADIDMFDKYGKNRESWVSIKTFAGIFDGNGHKITNLYINDTGDGLFSWVSGTVKNLGVEAYIYTTSDNAETSGGITAGLSGTIEKCFFSGSIEGDSHIGGITGALSRGGQIINCYNTAAIKGNHCIGGIVGTGGGTTNCYNAGSIIKAEAEWDSPYFGSITGSGGEDVTDCYYLEGTWDKGVCTEDYGCADTTTALTAEQLADKSNFTNWDFDTIWEMSEQHGRPVLRSNKENPPAPKHIHKICGEADCTDGHEDMEWIPWDGTKTLPTEAGNYYLTKDVTLTARWSPLPEQAVNLCLNGHIISTNNYWLFLIYTTTFTDCSDTQHKFSVRDDGLWTLDEENGTETVTGGVITGNDGSQSRPAIYIVRGGLLNMYKINVIGNCSGYGTFTGAVSVYFGDFTMYSGKIAGNIGREGCGVYNTSNTPFKMYGGEISHNTAWVKGGGVCVGKNMTIGGTAVIKDNIGDNLYINNADLLTIDKNKPLTDGAYISVTYGYDWTSVPINVTGSNDADYSKYFHSDNESYKIVNNENNAVTLTYKNNSYPYYEITDIYAIDAEYNHIKEIPANTEFAALCRLKQIASLDGKDCGIVIFAAYDDSGALIDTGHAKITPEELPYSPSVILKSGEKPVAGIKAFVWNTFNSMEPLAKTETLTFTE